MNRKFKLLIITNFVSSLSAREYILSNKRSHFEYIVLLENTSISFIGAKFKKASLNVFKLQSMFSDLDGVWVFPMPMKMIYVSLENEFFYRFLKRLKGIRFVYGLGKLKRFFMYLEKIGFMLDREVVVTDNSVLVAALKKRGYSLCFLEHGVSSYQMNYSSNSILVSILKRTLTPLTQSANFKPDRLFFLVNPNQKMVPDWLRENSKVSVRLEHESAPTYFEKNRSDYNHPFAPHSLSSPAYLINVPDILTGKLLCSYLLNVVKNIKHIDPGYDGLFFLKTHPRNSNIDNEMMQHIKSVYPEVCDVKAVCNGEDSAEELIYNANMTLVSHKSSLAFYALNILKRNFIFVDFMQEPYRGLLEMEYGFLEDFFEEKSLSQISFTYSGSD